MMATLARASVEGAVLVALVWLLARLLRLSPATRSVLWWCAAAKFVIALVWTAPVEIPALPADSAARAVVVQRVPMAPVQANHSPARAARLRSATPGPTLITSVSNGLREWSSFAAIGWTLGLAAAALVGARRWRETATMLRESVSAPPAIQAEAAALSTSLGLRTVPDVRVSPSTHTPLVMGLLRPVIVLPASRVGALTDEQRRMVICHELAHLKRADLWLGCIPALAERMFFFHPLAHVASREYALAREAACDASVMRTLGAAPQEYGRLLLALGVSPSRPGLTAAGAAWSFQNLKRRIAMLQDISVRSTRSRLLTASIIGLAVVALIPMRLVAKPGIERGATPGTTSLTVDQESAIEQSAKDQAVEKATPPRSDKRDVRFVLMSEDGSRTTSGASESADVERAGRQRRNGEPLLWFNYNGKEYVIRDVEVIREAQVLWSDVYRSKFDEDSIRKLTQAVDSLNVEELARKGALMAQRIADAGLIADQAQLIADQGRQAAEIGLMVADQVMRSLADGGLVEIDESKLEQQLQSIEKFDFDRYAQSFEKLGNQIAEDIGDKMHDFGHELNRSLHSQMKDLHEKLDDVDKHHLRLAEPLDDLGDQMKHFGRSIEEATRKATEEMRTLIERSMASGQAKPVR